MGLFRRYGLGHLDRRWLLRRSRGQRCLGLSLLLKHWLRALSRQGRGSLRCGRRC